MTKAGTSGQRVRLWLESWGKLGEALARIDDRLVFVFGGIPGEEVVAEIIAEHRRYTSARVVEVLVPSDQRVAAPCPYFGPCTGCQLQHVDYDYQLQLKRDVVADTLQKVGDFRQPPVADSIPSPKQYGYRNHARFTVGRNGDLGFVNRESRQFVAVDSCRLMHTGINNILSHLQTLCGETTQLSIRYGVNTGDFLIQPSLHSPDVALPTGQKHYSESLRDKCFRIASPSFFQVNLEQLDLLVDLVREGLALSGSELIVDAYAGVGTFAVLLAPYAGKVIAIEESPAAVTDGRANAKSVEAVEFVQGKTEEVLSQLIESPHGVILDPPRKGCHHATLEALNNLGPERVVYVSCDPGSLARDLKVLCNGAFCLESVQPVDMFPQTHHVESVATLRRRRRIDSLVLASGSPRREDLLSKLGVAFEVAPSLLVEDVGVETPEETVARLALAKAQKVGTERPGELIVGADTVVAFEEDVFGKPKSDAEAVDMLNILRNRKHRVITGVALTDTASGRSWVGVQESVVTMRDYSDWEISTYVASDKASDKAGAYGAQDEEFHPTSRIDGCRANVIGLPICNLVTLLDQAGYDIRGLALPDDCARHRTNLEPDP